MPFFRLKMRDTHTDSKRESERYRESLHVGEVGVGGGRETETTTREVKAKSKL